MRVVAALPRSAQSLTSQARYLSHVRHLPMMMQANLEHALARLATGLRASSTNGILVTALVARPCDMLMHVADT